MLPIGVPNESPRTSPSFSHSLSVSPSCQGIPIDTGRMDARRSIILWVGVWVLTEQLFTQNLPWIANWSDKEGSTGLRACGLQIEGNKLEFLATPLPPDPFVQNISHALSPRACSSGPIMAEQKPSYSRGLQLHPSWLPAVPYPRPSLLPAPRPPPPSSHLLHRVGSNQCKSNGHGLASCLHAGEDRFQGEHEWWVVGITVAVGITVVGISGGSNKDAKCSHGSCSGSSDRSSDAGGCSSACTGLKPLDTCSRRHYSALHKEVIFLPAAGWPSARPPVCPSPARLSACPPVRTSPVHPSVHPSVWLAGWLAQ